MAQDHAGEAALQQAFLNYQTVKLMEQLQAERPDLLRRLYTDPDAASIAAELHAHTSKKGQALKAIARPTKAAAKPASTSKPKRGWDAKDTNDKVAAILRQR